MEQNNNINRRTFLKLFGGATLATAAVTACGKRDGKLASSRLSGQASGEMTMRTNAQNGDKVSLLGYGCMRFPTKKKADGTDEVDQEEVNKLIDAAIKGGVNFFDTAPVYVQGMSETATGIALSRHPREKYFIATKLSNFSPAARSLEGSKKMYEKSFRDLQAEYIDYYFMHSIGNMEAWNDRFINNGVLDFLKKEKQKGKIRNLGWSFHGEVAFFDYMMSLYDSGEFKVDFVMIQHNYVDFRHASGRNVNSEYLTGELQKRNIPTIIMEPLRGGRLATLNEHLTAQMKQREPEASIASWAFRFAGMAENIITVLSGITYMEHVQDNLATYSPLVPLTTEELDMLEHTAQMILRYPTVPCTYCQYCMPCPYGVDIPNNFEYYNRCVNAGNVPRSVQDADYRRARRVFLVGYDRSVEKLRQAKHCINCDECVQHCPQSIDIPKELIRIDTFVEKLKQDTLFEELDALQASCVIRNGKETRQFFKPGVADLWELTESKSEFLRGATITDKVVGKAAAALMINGGVAEVYAHIISRDALALLQKHKVKVKYAQCVKQIRNRDQTDICPLEKTCTDTDNIPEIIENLGAFITSMQK